ncbi:YbbR-like protein [Eubacterium brachy ATCC 33089]|nr:YbbR-like protein [Eubacterium brachy ATCC 33089]
MLRNKKVNILIAFVAALALWIYVTGKIEINSMKKFSDVKISIVNQNSLIESGYAVEKIEPGKIDVTLKGGRAALNSAKGSDIKATVDVYSRFKGKNNVNVDVEVPKNTRLESKSEDKVTVEIGNLVTAERNIEVHEKESLPEKTVLVKSKPDPEKVKIYGTKKNVAKVVSVRALVDTSKVTEKDTEVSAKLVPVDKSGNVVDFVSVASDEINITVRLEAYKTVKLNAKTKGSIDDKYQLDSIKSPEKIDIQGPAGTIKGITEVESEDIDISKIRESTKIKMVLRLPEGVKIKEGSEEPFLNVTIKRNNAKTFKFDISDVNIENLGENLSLNKGRGEITVVVRSKNNGKVDLEKSDIKLYGDGRNFKRGSNTVTLYTNKDDEYIVEIRPKTLTINVK